MLISIVIPTRERAGVLRHALASCVRIPDDRLEIVVSDNASVDETSAVVAEQRDPRVRYVRTPERCSMRENFEFGVAQARGDYVFVMGDDDAPIPSQFGYMRRLLEEHAPDSLTGVWVKYAWPGDWPGDSEPKVTGRVKLGYRSVYGRPEIVSGAQLRADLESNGSITKWDAPRLYGGAMSRRVIERLKEKSGQLFMGSWPDVYMTFASPSVIERHLKVKHPFFIGAASPKSNGRSFSAWSRATAPDGEYMRFETEAKLDPLIDPIAVKPTVQIGEFSFLEAANRYAYGGKLQIDYAREFERALQSLRDVGKGQKAAAVEALARFAVERGLPAELGDASILASRCPPPAGPHGVWRRGRKRSYVSVDRVVIALDEREPTDVDAAAAAYDKLLGVAAANATPRPVAWLGLLGRAIGMLLSRRLGRRARPPLSERQRPATGA
jgi:glycosyltransferase involved in cell wall biosynthesis